MKISGIFREISTSNFTQIGDNLSVFWASIEGPIGAGKSTLGAKLNEHLKTKGYNVFYLSEYITPLMESGLFQDYCANPERFAYQFQTKMFHERTRQFLTLWHSSIQHTSGKVVIITERSIVSDTIFMHVQLDQGKCSQRELDDYLALNEMWRSLYPVAPNLFIYCKPSGETANVCQGRIEERQRPGERVLVDVEYNKCVLKHHEKMFLQREDVLLFDSLPNYRDDESVAGAKCEEIHQKILQETKW